jgi:hypothetical protein
MAEKSKQFVELGKRVYLEPGQAAELSEAEQQSERV